MRMPATGKLFKHAKATGRKAFVIYLGDPTSKDVTEMAYEGTLYPEDFEALKNFTLELMTRNQKRAVERREQARAAIWTSTEQS